MSLLEQSQLIWSSYGYSYLYDNVNSKRHRTLPSAIAYYPFKIYAANQSGVYQYIPTTHSINEIIQGDQRDEIESCIEANDIEITSASFIILPFLDTNAGGAQYQRFWYYENGAIIHNVILEATALNLYSNVIYDITDESGLRSAVGIPSQTNLVPLSVIPVGSPYTNPNNPPETPDISGISKGNAGSSYTYTFNSVDPDGDDVYYYIKWDDGYLEIWDGPYNSGIDVDISHTYANEGTFVIQAKAKDTEGLESNWAEFTVTMPRDKAMYFLFFRLIYNYPCLYQFLQSLL